MSEEDTFNTLRRIPFLDMLALYQAEPTYSGVKLHEFFARQGWTVAEFMNQCRMP